MQVYTGKPAGAQPERNLGKRVVTEMTHGLQGHIVTCDNFFLHHMLLAQSSFKKNEELLEQCAGTSRSFQAP